MVNPLKRLINNYKSRFVWKYGEIRGGVLGWNTLAGNYNPDTDFDHMFPIILKHRLRKLIRKPWTHLKILGKKIFA